MIFDNSGFVHGLMQLVLGGNKIVVRFTKVLSNLGASADEITPRVSSVHCWLDRVDM